MSDFAYADNIRVLSNSYREMQGLLEAVNRHAAAVGMRINGSKTNVMSELSPGEQRKAVLRYGEPLVSVFVTNGGQGLPGSGALNFALRFRDMACRSSRRNDVGLCAISGTLAPPLRYKCTGTGHKRTASLVWSCCKTTRR